jgi:hypothetical protein
MTRLSRRAMLRGMLGGAAVGIGLPVLECMLSPGRSAYAGNGVVPMRFGLFTWGNGMIPDLWIPEGEGEVWTPSVQLSALAPVQPKISVVTGMEVRVPNTIPHFSGQYGFLTAIEPIGEEGNHTPSGPTVDQIIAAEIGGETRFRSLETGVKSKGASFAGPYSPMPAEESAHAFFERIFGAGFREPGDDTPIDPKIALRRSVLDVVVGQAQSLESRLGASDKARLDQHLTGIRDLELRLARMEDDPVELEACVKPADPGADPISEDIVARHRALTDLMVMALACDQTRVFHHAFTAAVGNHQYPGISEGHHKLTHDEPGDQPQVQAITLQIMEELAYFIQALDAVPEGDGTLLDHMAVLCTSDVSLGRTHGLDEFPIIFAGSACGRLKTGLHYRSTTRENASKAGLTMMRTMGLPREAWGEGDARTTDSIGAVEA